MVPAELCPLADIAVGVAVVWVATLTFDDFTLSVPSHHIQVKQSLLLKSEFCSYQLLTWSTFLAHVNGLQ